jgi:GNAT superfamily N-acetyltransferase
MTSHLTAQVSGSELFIVDLYVTHNKRQQGVGVNLILAAAEYARTRRLSLIKLDDLSKMYRTNKRNIYFQCGFHYDESEGPEMTGRTFSVLRASKNKCLLTKIKLSKKINMTKTNNYIQFSTL